MSCHRHQPEAMSADSRQHEDVEALRRAHTLLRLSNADAQEERVHTTSELTSVSDPQA